MCKRRVGVHIAQCTCDVHTTRKNLVGFLIYILIPSAFGILGI